MRRHKPLVREARGFTLVELMVALIIALLVLIATVSFYLMTRSTYTTIDDSSNLEERGQFALGVVTRALRQAGFTPLNSASGGMMQLYTTDPPMISGLDGCSNPVGGDSLTTCGSTPTANGNDAIEVRFFGSGTDANQAIPDNSMVDCSGQGVASYSDPSLASSQRGLSIFYIQTDATTGVPYLACMFRPRDSNGVEGTTFATQQLVPGVEALQFLYGVSTNDTVPDVYKRAADMSPTDWLNVYAVKVAMVIRADNVSADPSAGTPTFTLFGSGYTNTDGTFTPTRNLTSARRLISATIQVRNYLTCYQGDKTCI
ncbi:PilW family protein [Ralstonia chuxiongensis]|uniref:PilW family protein n=1 Tax=Ralstonia chuxiongensis TaxID=2957504 RepID=A0AA42BH00_9RALS|nr:PilW family protein [Ralstonia chuxiongensis]MCP1172681.1 PilW family protein [Ralstonia chuxiongensis]